MKLDFYEKVENSITSIRLSVYKERTHDDYTALASYLFNIEVCRALYTPLHMFEIVLRNSVDKHLQIFTGEKDWFDNNVIPLTPIGVAMIQEAKDTILAHNKTVTHDRIISELNLGFWTSLFSKTYSQCSFQGNIIKNCLKGCPKKLRTYTNINLQFENLRQLRNRVAHHERVIHWNTLKDLHNQLLECIKWINSETYELTKKIDTFDKVYKDGEGKYQNLVNNNWN